MSARCRKLPASFGPETRFELKPAPAIPYRTEQVSRFEQLKDELLAAQVEEVRKPELRSQMARVANEAAALAWVTPYPLLMFPLLFEEKVEVARIVSERQKQVRRRTRELLAL